MNSMNVFNKSLKKEFVNGKMDQRKMSTQRHRKTKVGK